MLFSNSNQVNAQENTNAPQLYNNLSALWNINDRFSFGGNIALNYVLNKNYYWRERAFTATLVYHLRKKIDVTGGAYSSFVNQNEYLKSREVRGVLGLRFFRPSTHRFVVSNFSRLEFRTLFYSDGDNNFTIRARNLTHLFFSLTKKKMNLRNNLFLLSYFELFYNFQSDVRERFFNLYKVKLGAGYRFNIPISIDLGLIYQDSEENDGLPVNLPVNYDTHFILEWRVVYFFNDMKEKQKAE